MGLLAEAFDKLFNPQHHAYVGPSALSFGKTLTSHAQSRCVGEAATLCRRNTGYGAERAARVSCPTLPIKGTP